MVKSQVLIASDHGGFELKNSIIDFLRLSHREVIDYGPFSSEAVDYPDFANRLAQNMKRGVVGVLICGSGIGMSIAANRHKHIRAALCRNPIDATLARRHNDANVLVLGARFTNIDEAFKILEAFLSAEFEGGRHEIRVRKLEV